MMTAKAKKETAPDEKWLFWSPRGYLDFTKPVSRISDCEMAEFYCFSLTISDLQGYTNDKFPTTNFKDMYRLAITFTDVDGETVKSVVFGNPWPWKKFKKNDAVHVYGKLSMWVNSLQIENMTLLAPSDVGTVMPVYRGIPGRLSAERIMSGIAASESMIDRIDQSDRWRGLNAARTIDGFRSIPEFMHTLHCPSTLESGQKALAAAAFLSLSKLILDAMQRRVFDKTPRSIIPIDIEVVRELNGKLPYQLTANQKLVIKDIIRDLRADTPMRRVLNGDVGSGKSLSFLLPAVAAVREGALVGIMTPNRLLVRQLARDVATFFPGVPVQALEPGDNIVGPSGIVISTTALIGARKRYKKAFDLVIVDEQHKFSVGQKMSLVDEHTNLLETTATPMPRSLAIIAFGGMDVSILSEMPVKKEITTHIMRSDQRKDLMAMVMNVVKSGKQVAVVYSRVSDSEDEKHSIEKSADKWERNAPGKTVVLHGKMSDDEKAAAIDAMMSGEKQVLVASSVIEIGVTLPDLKCLVVVDAGQFGVSQLHQMRGRVARTGGPGDFILYLPDQAGAVDEDDSTRMQRMELIKAHNDGFNLSEQDLLMRGYGDLSDTSDDQCGTSDLLFSGVKISYPDIKKAVAEGLAGR